VEQKILSDENQFPTEKIIFSHIGKSKAIWESLFEYIRRNHPDFDAQWRYYKDGKSWLMKVARKSKTIFWLSVIKDAFRITFYFGDKAEAMIMESALPPEMKKEFEDAKRYNKIRGITLTMRDQSDIGNAKILVMIKLKMK
jgi:hypothetical protein